MEASREVVSTNENVIGARHDFTVILFKKTSLETRLHELDQLGNKMTEKKYTLVMTWIEAAYHENKILQKHSVEALNAATNTAHYIRVAYDK